MGSSEQQLVFPVSFVIQELYGLKEQWLMELMGKSWNYLFYAEVGMDKNSTSGPVHPRNLLNSNLTLVISQ